MAVTLLSFASLAIAVPTIELNQTTMLCKPDPLYFKYPLIEELLKFKTATILTSCCPLRLTTENSSCSIGPHLIAHVWLYCTCTMRAHYPLSIQRWISTSGPNQLQPSISADTMAFGYFVSNFLSLAQLAGKGVQNARKACTTHEELTMEVVTGCTHHPPRSWARCF